MNQTAHISLQILSNSKSVETKMTGCALTYLARPASFASDFILPPRCRPVCLARLAPRWCISAPPVRWVLGLVAETRKRFFKEMSSFFRNSCYFFKISVLLSIHYRISLIIARLLVLCPPLFRVAPSTCRVIHRPTPKKT
jgi:hypothetical protein